jgi:hypothetical protein
VFSCDQSLVGEAFASHARDKAVKPCKGVVSHVAVIETERKFIDIAAKVLRAGVVPCAGWMFFCFAAEREKKSAQSSAANPEGKSDAT